MPHGETFQRRARAGLKVAAAVLCALMPSAVASADPPSLQQAAGSELMAKANAKPGRKIRPRKPSPAAAADPAPAKVLSRTAILEADPAILERTGRHLVVGYHSPATVKALVEKKAIAGIFITDHNVRRRKVADIRAEIDALQALRAGQGMPPLIVAADQEGGAVSRLSPPLRRQPGLARVIAKVPAGGDVKAAVVEYARVQASELKRIGVNLNFSPVVDLKIDPKRRSDGETQLRHRALSADPKVVSEAAGWYCDTLREEGVYCTIKHFPGLGRVSLDTHRKMGEIKAPLIELNGADFVPFRSLIGRPHVVTMLGHVRLSELDGAVPASFSKTVIDGLLRTEWGHGGLIITDDFSMGAVTRSKDGVGGAAVKALNAGADLVLVSFSDRDLNAVMTALLEADGKGELDAGKRADSVKRLGGLPAAQPPLPPPAGPAPKAEAGQ
jgi:beta-N-acetylhexosaminidase